MIPKDNNRLEITILSNLKVNQNEVPALVVKIEGVPDNVLYFYSDKTAILADNKPAVIAVMSGVPEQKIDTLTMLGALTPKELEHITQVFDTHSAQGRLQEGAFDRLLQFAAENAHDHPVEEPAPAEAGIDPETGEAKPEPLTEEEIALARNPLHGVAPTQMITAGNHILLGDTPGEQKSIIVADDMAEAKRRDDLMAKGLPVDYHERVDEFLDAEDYEGARRYAAQWAKPGFAEQEAARREQGTSAEPAR